MPMPEPCNSARRADEKPRTAHLLAYILLCLLQPLTVDICQNEMCTFSPQGTRCCQPDATRSTGNDSDCASKVRQCHRDCSSQQKNKRYASTLPLCEDGCQMLTLMVTHDIARSQSVKPLPKSPHQV